MISDEQAIQKAFNSLSPSVKFVHDSGKFTAVMSYSGSEVERFTAASMKEVLFWLEKTYPEALWNPFDYGEHNLPHKALMWLRAAERRIIFGRKPKNVQECVENGI